MTTYSLPSEAPCPQCGRPTLACEFDDGGNSVGDYTFVFTHTCPCGFSQSASHTIGYDQESRLDGLCDFCERDWLIASAQIDATRRGISVTAAPPPPPDQPAEVLYESPPPVERLSTNILSANAEFKRYLAAHPETLYTLSPRRFEELIADILQDYGFDVELTPATRDGGVDIYACLHTPICTSLVVVECKLYQPNHHVGMDFFQRLHGVQSSKHANQGMPVTTAFYTRPAIAEARLYRHFMELKDYNHIKDWLNRYAR